MKPARNRDAKQAPGKRRAVMLSSEIESLSANEDTFHTSSSVSFGVIAQGLKVEEREGPCLEAVPDVLRQAHTFDTAMMEDRDPEAVGAWLGLVSAILLAPDSHIHILRIPLDEAGGSLFMRSVSKSLLNRARGEDYRFIKLFLYRGRLKSAPWVPVAFALCQDAECMRYSQAYRALLIPAAEISFELDCDLPWYGAFQREDPVSDALDQPGRVRDYYAFGNPLEALGTQPYIAQSTALYDALKTLASKHRDLARVLEGCFRALPCNPGIAKPFRLRSDVFADVGGAVDQGEEILRLNRYLTEYLCLIQREDPARPSMQNTPFLRIQREHRAGETSFSDAVLPLSPAFGDHYLGLSEAERVQALRSLEGMTLTESGQGENATYTLQWRYQNTQITKQYGPGQHTPWDEFADRRFPQAALWPRAKLDKQTDERFAWKHYYLYVKERRSHDDIALSVYPRAGKSINRNAGGGLVSAVSQFPEVLLVRQNGMEAGLVLPKAEPLNYAGDGAACVLSVDFGTSNTIAYMGDLSEALPQYVKLGSFLLPISTGDDEGDYCLSFFSSKDFEEALFISMLRVQGTFGPLHETAALLGSSIPFTTVFDIDGALRNQLYFDLKWHNVKDAAAKSRTKAFLTQLVQMYSFIAVMRRCTYLFWRFSWPRAMTLEEFDNFKASVREIVSANTALPHTISFFSEAEAVGSYITATPTAAAVNAYGWRPVLPTQGFACIDIGGGSVDISVWQENQLRAEASLRDVAANTVLCESIVHCNDPLPPRVELLRVVFASSQNEHPQIDQLGEDLISLLESKAADDKERFKKKWTLNIGDISQVFRMRSAAAEDLEDLRGYLRMIEVYLSLVVFFTATMVRQAIAEGRMGDRFNGQFSLLFSGNGSQMIRFLYSGEPKDFRGTEVYARLQMLYALGLGKRDLPQIIVPLRPKHEVAFGMASRLRSLEERQAQSNWQEGSANEAVTLERLNRLFDGEAIEVGEDQKLAWVTQRSFEECKDALKAFFEGFWSAMKSVHGALFPRAVLDVFNLSAPTPEEARDRMVDYTRNLVDMLDTNAAEEYRRDLNTMFSYVLQRIVLQSRGK